MTRWLSLVLFISGIYADTEFQFEDGDYTQYRTLPKHRITKWNITYHDRAAVAPGYWFTAPYWQWEGDHKTNQWIPYQIGPHIFDQDGDLVWTGSTEFDNLNVHDFRRIELPDETGQLQPYLAWMLSHKPYDMESEGTAAIYDHRYQVKKILHIPASEIDTHDFTVKYSPRVMQIQSRPEWGNLAELGRPDIDQLVFNVGFSETDLITEERIFEWKSPGKVTLNESYVMLPEDDPPNLDWMHANAVDKNENGDYLLSARHTSAIYLISGKDGHIIWRLGGKRSDFQMDFTFFGQHDCRFMSVNSTHMVISLLNNGAMSLINNGVTSLMTRDPTSSAMYVELDLVNMVATLLRRYMRPDGGSTQSRGNFQTLPNGNAFVAWSQDGYMTEHSNDGRLLMEAKFASDRHDTYRAYKFPWTGRPSYPPTLLSEAYGVNGSELSTVFHVSWNGATDIAYWRFYSRSSSTSTGRKVVGTVAKKGFETAFIARGYMDWVSVEALDANLEVLGESRESRTAPPEYWDPTAPLPRPDDPEALLTIPEHAVQTPSHDRGDPIFFFVGFIACGAVYTPVIYRRVLTHFILSFFSKLDLNGYSKIGQHDSGYVQEAEDSFKSL